LPKILTSVLSLLLSIILLAGATYQGVATALERRLMFVEGVAAPTIDR